MDEPQIEAEPPQALFRIGLNLFNQARYAEALPYFDRAIAGDATSGSYWAFRGTTNYALKRDSVLVVHDLDQALSLLDPPTDRNSRRLRGLLLRVRGGAFYLLKRYAEAATGLDEARQYGPLDASFSIWQGESYRAIGRLEEARAAYRRALDDPTREQTALSFWLRAVEGLLDLRDFTRALEAAQVAVDQRPENFLGWVGRARALLGLARYQESFESVERALALDDQNSSAWSIKGAAARGLKRYDEARDAYHRAAALATSSPEARAANIQDEVRMLLRLRRFGEAWRMAIGEAERLTRERRRQSQR